MLPRCAALPPASSIAALLNSGGLVPPPMISSEPFSGPCDLGPSAGGGGRVAGNAGASGQAVVGTGAPPWAAEAPATRSMRSVRPDANRMATLCSRSNRRALVPALSLSVILKRFLESKEFSMSDVTVRKRLDCLGHFGSNPIVILKGEAKACGHRIDETHGRRVCSRQRPLS